MAQSPVSAPASRSIVQARAASEQVVYEVACIGDTFRSIDIQALGIYKSPHALDAGDLRGSPFWVEGIIYPEGTIAGDGFVPTLDGAIGHWFCRGHFVVHPGRALPHIMSHHEYMFGLSDPENPFPPDMISSVGFEGTGTGELRSMRAVNGGTGRFMGATGQVAQTHMGPNGTVLFGFDFPADNFRFEFDLRLP